MQSLHINTHQIFKFLSTIFLFTFSLFATPIHYAPVMVGDITTFVPYSHVQITLGNDKSFNQGEDNILTAKVNYPSDIVRYEWREDGKLLGTDSTLPIESLSSGAHHIILTVIDNNGLSTSDKINIILRSSEYIGKKTKVTLNDENYLKYIRAANYLENLNWDEIPSSSIGISEKSYRNNSEEVLTRTYEKVKYKDALLSGTVILTFDNKTIPDKTLKKMEISLIFSTYENNITVKISTHSEGNYFNDFLVDKYYIYDEKYNEHIDILGIDSKNPRLYLGSEGYVDIDTNSENFRVLGKNNTNLSLIFKSEEAIYETKELLVEPSSTYQSLIYSPKRGQGIIESILNGVNKENLYFLPYQVSYFEPVKFYENNGQIQLLEDRFFSWHAKYMLLNEDTSNIEINIEWYVNGIKVETPISYELPNIYNSDDIVKIVVTAKNGDMIIKKEQLSTEYDFDPWAHISTQLDETFDILYRTNNLEFNLDILLHEYFNDIDIANSQFSWYIGSDYHDAQIINGTEYNKVPTILANKYGNWFDSVYLKIYNEHEIKVVRFKITLEKGSTGLDNLPNIIESIDEASLTNNNEYIDTSKVWNFDIDKNGLNDIIYQSETYNGSFLNISYQNTKRVFEFEKKLVNGTVYLGDFDGDTSKEAFIFSNDIENTKIMNLDKGNIHITKDINLSSYLNILAIKAVDDMNNDGKDDLIVANNKEKKLYIYDDIYNTLEKRLIGDNKCVKILSIEDINDDGLKDIICTPEDKVNYLYTNNSEDYFSSELIIKFYLQNSDNSFTINSRQYILIDDATFHEVSGIRVSGATILNDSTIAVSLNDKDGNMLYVCELNNYSLEPLSKTQTNTYDITTFFTPKDINHDGLSDLISFDRYGGGVLNIFNQKQNFEFESDYSESINSYYQLTDRSLRNAFLDDIDNDGSLEIVTVNGENKFSYINLK